MSLTHATATLPKYLLYSFTIADLDDCFAKYEVSLKSVKFGDDFVSLKIYGDKFDIRDSVKKLYNLINNYYKIHLEDRTAAQNIPENFNKNLNNYEELAEAYRSFCKTHNIEPHPEVI